MIWFRGFNYSPVRQDDYPFNLPGFRNFSGMQLTEPVTIFVGENGSGKSTLLKSLAIYMNLPAIGSIDLERDESLEGVRALSNAMKGQWNTQRVHRGFFFRAEDYFGFAKRLKNIDAELDKDIVDFEKNLTGTGLKQAVGSIYGQKDALKRKYGDLYQVSHGEGFIKVIQQRLQPEGIYLIDEPEAALSPQRQLSLYAMIKNLAEEARCQFIIATHSPILMTLPNSQLYEFGDTIEETSFEETEHFTIMKQFLNNPEAFTRFL